MVTVIDVTAQIEKPTMLRDRTPWNASDRKREAIVTAAPYRDGAVFASKFSGDSGWERHPQGEEIVWIIEGSTTVTLLTDNGPSSFTLSAGMMIIVPQGTWHRFDAPEGLTLVSVTRQPTDHPTADVEDPRTIDDSPG